MMAKERQQSGQLAAPRITDEDDVILASWTLHDVLRRYPQLLEVLIGLTPAFGKLRNPVLRRVQTRLVTVTQAAQIAGLEPAAVVRTLNTAAGQVTPPEAGADAPELHDTPESVDFTATPAAAPVAVDLDVRPFLARGEEPFRAIMMAVRDIPVGQALRLHVGFEPLPLYDLLAKRGFRHTDQQLGPEDWEITFLRLAPGMAGGGAEGIEPAVEASPPTAAQTPPNTLPEGIDATVQIDVSDLVPPEPMVRILEALEQLAPRADAAG
jgi:uncharacterized protein (DUF2249 family)